MMRSWRIEYDNNAAWYRIPYHVTGSGCTVSIVTYFYVWIWIDTLKIYTLTGFLSDIFMVEVVVGEYFDSYWNTLGCIHGYAEWLYHEY
jgi:hypothetical protein